MIQYHVRNTYLSVLRLGSHFHQESTANHAVHDVDNLYGKELLLKLLFERDGRVQDYLHEVHKRAVAARNSGHIVRKLAQVNSFYLTDHRLDHSYDDTSLNVLLNLFQVTLQVKLSHCCRAMTSF